MTTPLTPDREWWTAEEIGIGTRTIWAWFAAVEGVRLDDRLPYLAPRNRAAQQRHIRQKDCDPEFFDLIKSDFLRLEAPPFTDCYRRAARVAKKKGLSVLPERTMRRRLDASVSEATQICTRTNLSAANASTALGAVFRSADVAWTFPVTFIAAPVVQGDVDDADCWLTTSGAPSATTVNVRAIAAVTKAGALTLRATAIGRWF